MIFDGRRDGLEYEFFKELSCFFCKNVSPSVTYVTAPSSDGAFQNSASFIVADSKINCNLLGWFRKTLIEKTNLADHEYADAAWLG